MYVFIGQFVSGVVMGKLNEIKGSTITILIKILVDYVAFLKSLCFDLVKL